MKVNIEIVEGAYYYCKINDKWWWEYRSSADIQFLNKVCKKLLNDLEIQNHYTGDNQTIISEEDFVKNVKEHNNSKEVRYGNCEDNRTCQITLDLEIYQNNNKQYDIGSGDYYGKCEANNKFNKELLPFLLKLNISDSDIYNIANLVSDIYDLAYDDGYDNAEHELKERI